MEPTSGTLEADVLRLHNALDGAAVRALRRQESLVIAASGGLDSSVLATLIAEHADIPIQLVTAGVPGALDPTRARLLSRHLRLPLLEVSLSEERVEPLLRDLVPLMGPTPLDPDRAREWGVAPDTPYVDPVLVGVELPLFVAMRETSRFATRLVVGQGADEYFLGYQRYLRFHGPELDALVERDRARLDDVVRPLEKRLADACEVQLNYPYLDPGVRQLALAFPREHLLLDGERKIVLRRLAKQLGLPSAIVDVPKTAAQYGSGSADLLRRLAEKAGKHQNEYLTVFAQR